MKVRILGHIPDGYQIQPIEEDEEEFAKLFDEYPCGFHSKDDALSFALYNELEVVE